MKTFSGFPAGKVRSASIPEPVFTELVPIVDDLAELKLTLHVLWRLGQQRGRVRYLRRADLAADQVLLSGLGDAPTGALNAALERAVERGTLLRVEATIGEMTEELYFANTARGRAAVEAIARGGWPDELESAARPNVFTLYEQNIGLLIPLIADELRQAEKDYPAEWVEEAFREAVSLNKRSWKYIRAILERWRTEGRGEKTSRRITEADRRRYSKWKQNEPVEH
ncbi:MAG: DnaD domain protein [Anaerolineae bacterium]|nr:DnaD domain protein [Anaerolineae bacterium]